MIMKTTNNTAKTLNKTRTANCELCQNFFKITYAFPLHFVYIRNLKYYTSGDISTSLSVMQYIYRPVHSYTVVIVSVTNE